MMGEPRRQPPLLPPDEQHVADVRRGLLRQWVTPGRVLREAHRQFHDDPRAVQEFLRAVNFPLGGSP